MKEKLINTISSFFKKILRLFIKLALYFLALLILLTTLLYIPPIQSYIAGKTEETLSEKFNSEVQIGSLNLNLFGNFIMKDVSVKDPTGNEIFQLENIDFTLSIFPLIYRTIHLDHLEIQGLKYNLEIDKERSSIRMSPDQANQPSPIQLPSK